MKILYILPSETVRTGGNWVTATRLSEGLKKRGIYVDIIEVKDVSKDKIIDYDVVHAFHAFKSLTKIKHLIMDKTVIVSFTGTDLEQLQQSGKDKAEITDLLNKIDSIIVFHGEAKEELIKEGILKEKVNAIPQTPLPMIDVYKGKEQSTQNLKSSNCVTFLFAAGIRKVKAPLEVIEMMSILEEKLGNIRLIIIGPILEKDLGEKVKARIEGEQWIKYLGEVSHQEVQRFISESDIVINGSISEGMSNILLEAQQIGKPILATDVAGNRAIVTHGVDGFLFKGRDEFDYYSTKLVKDFNLRIKMGLSAIESIKSYSLEDEISIYEEVYKG